MATEALAVAVINRSNELTSSNKLGQVVEAHPACSAIQVDGAIQPVINIAPAPKISAKVTNSESVALPYIAGSSASPLSVPHMMTDTAPQSVPPPTGDETLDAAAVTTTQLPPSEDSPPVADNEVMDVPQPMPQTTSDDTTTKKNGQPDIQQPNPSPSLKGRVQTKKCRQPKEIQDGTTDTLKVHTSGLTEPDINSLLELIQTDDGFEEKSMSQRAKVAEAVVAMRDASQSEEWSNLLRGVIILTMCLGFLNGNVSERHT